MDMDKDISFEEFYVSLVSFERGLAYAMGIKPCSEEYLRGVASQWFSVCGFGRESDTLKGNKLGKQKFFDFCTNRHYSVRLLLEGYASSAFPPILQEDIVPDLAATIADRDEGAVKGPGGGDEWLANPPWRKTAEKMVPKNCVRNSEKPETNCILEWVHGYRGFDSRNNVRYSSKEGSHFAFFSAALGVVQSVDREKQHFFGDHTDDVTCMAVYEPDTGENEKYLIATGNMGTNAAIHIWKPANASSPVNSPSVMCMTGCHPKGVSQLVFSTDGNLLFSIGVEYSIAVYNINAADAKFGKLIASGKGPNGKVALHACAFGDGKFMSCGDKHVVVWSIFVDKGVATCVNAQLGDLKNKVNILRHSLVLISFNLSINYF